jgi:hypothetical protein
MEKNAAMRFRHLQVRLIRDLRITRSHHLTTASSRIAEQCDQCVLPAGAPAWHVRLIKRGLAWKQATGPAFVRRLPDYGLASRSRRSEVRCQNWETRS